MTAVAASDSSASEIPSAPAPKKRTPLLIGALVLAASTAAGGWYLTHVGTESTDDAQVEGRVMNVAARVPGQVLHVHVEDNQRVEAGQVLVEIDPADYQAKVDVARADLAAARAAAEGARSALALTEKTAPAALVQARGGVKSASSSIAAAHAAVAQARADVDAAEAHRALAELNAKRARDLQAQNAVAIAEVDDRRTELDEATAQLEERRAKLVAVQASLDGTGGGLDTAKGRLSAAETAEEQVASARASLALAEARVQQTEAALKLAELNLSYTTVRATRRGVVSRRSVEEGQMVSPDRALFAIVPLDDVWIVANFKEDQLAEMHAGQPATVRLDTYGRRTFTGHVDSVAGGTGARFALLPPDNATGNFVKVVQRVPVLVRLDGAGNAELRPGMSADVTVRVADR